MPQSPSLLSLCSSVKLSMYLEKQLFLCLTKQVLFSSRSLKSSELLLYRSLYLLGDDLIELFLLGLLLLEWISLETLRKFFSSLEGDRSLHMRSIWSLLVFCVSINWSVSIISGFMVLIWILLFSSFESVFW